jgi:hypothetical protein
MSGHRHADALNRGFGAAARAVGTWCDAFRPRGASAPLAPANRFLRLPVSFGPPSERWRTPEYGGVVWWGSFDAAYTRVGDYLRRGDGAIWFIAAQEMLQPVLCVRAVRTLDVARPAGAAQLGVNDYGGVSLSATTPLLTGFPAAVLGAGMASADDGGLPSDVPAGSWQVLLPAAAGVVLRNGDVITDDLGRTAIVAAAEVTQLGWRLQARQATT